jgi:hypothetical protein
MTRDQCVASLGAPVLSGRLELLGSQFVPLLPEAFDSDHSRAIKAARCGDRP